jgi:arylformamidase
LTRVWRDYDQAGLDAQYDNRAAVPDFRRHLAEYRRRSDAARAALKWTELAYGETPAERLDLFAPPRPNAPVHVFVHGGAWQLLEKEDSAIAAPLVHGAGGLFVALGFASVPAVRLPVMVEQVRRALAWVRRNAAAHGGDPDRITVSGHSSGAHLAAMAASPALRGALLVSGLYDLEPVRLSYRNQILGLSEAEARSLSPLPLRDAIVAAAAGDSDEFRRQSRTYAETCGVPYLEVAGRNHYDVALGFGEADDPVGRALLSLLAR